MSEHKSAPQILKFFKFPLLVFVSFLSLLIINSSLLIKVARAANAIPPPGRIPCDPTLVADPEYASDRPYQASPCEGDGATITYWCGNDVVVMLGTSKTPYCDSANGQQTVCPCNGGPNCDHTGSNMQTIDIDLTNVELPILGNTNDTNNSQTGDTIDDGTKVSNYVAWYLGGVDNRAEYPGDATTPEGLSRIVDFSGPTRRLLPSIIQEATRSATVASANNQVTYTDSETNQTVTEAENHNQIVVCGKEGNGGFFGWILDVLNLGKTNPIDCYTGGGSPTQGTGYRLNDWQGDLSFWNSGINAIVSGLASLFPTIPASVIQESVGDHWNSRLPPLPWCDKDCKPFASDALYQKAYNEWQGKTCVLIPGINLVVCIDNIFVPNKYADLFPYIPLAKNIDKKGAHMILDTHLDAPKATIECGSQGCYEIIHNPQLYLAHSVENYQLSSLLKNTYLPGEASGSAAATLPTDVENNVNSGLSGCRIIPSRSNSGDDATFDEPKSHIEVDVSYIATDFRCTNIHEVCDDPQCTTTHWEGNCSSDVYATIATVSKTPFANEIWKNTVAGSDSIFRRIYPKTGVGAPIRCIADNPAQSKATYTVDPNSSKEVQLWRIIEPDKSAVTGPGGNQGSDEIEAQLYYPHYGGVLDYFLNGIQQALRPKGFGPGQPQNGQYCTNVACGELPDLPKASGSCNLGGVSSKVGNIPQGLKDIVSAAAQTYSVPPGLIIGVMYGEGAFNTDASGNYTRYNWTEENVKNWASCEPLPNCSASADPINSVVPFYHTYWDKIADDILPDLKKIDPTKTQADPCNLLDITFGLAKDLHDNAGGAGIAGNSCFGITLTSTIPSSCDWSDDQYETSIKVWENGADPACYTKPGSCLLGTGGDTCPFDTGNTPAPGCESAGAHSTDPGVNSHNACVWDVSHGN
ncbi:MAG: hypothetical protein HYV90_01090 [Candidatus Woesebacteria bacterium]|nr:MAG: hypothetical protein HYV90_01090 [Candidatus Woesebacteria bacterium]